MPLFRSLNIKQDYLKMQNIYKCFTSICLLKYEICFALLRLANWFLTCLRSVPEAFCLCCQQFSCLVRGGLCQRGSFLFHFMLLYSTVFQCILFNFVLFSFILFHSILLYFIPIYFIFFYFIFSYSILSISFYFIQFINQLSLIFIIFLAILSLIFF